MEIIQKKVEELIPYANNPRNNEDAVDFVAASIAEFGFKVPIVIDKNNIIVTGHTRTLAAKKLKLESVPCVVAEDLTPAQVKAFRLADNRVADIATWNVEKMVLELEDIELDMSQFAFDASALEEPEELEEAETEQDEAPERDSAPARVSTGDVWQLGRHRLACGDSTQIDVLKRATGGELVDLVFTDPPYGMKKEADGVANDNLNFDDLLEFNKTWIPLTFEMLQPVGSWYCWGIDEPLMDIYSNILKPMIKAGEITFRNLLTWDKGNGQGQMAKDFRQYPTADEKCLFVMKGVQGFNNNADHYFEGFEPIRLYLEQEIGKLDKSDKVIANALGFKDGRTVNHWWNKSQWIFPNRENYNKLKQYAEQLQQVDAFKKDYDEIKKDYDEIKKDYDEIKKDYYASRAYFNNTHDNMNNVWHFGRHTNKEEAGGHATPKPLDLCGRAIKSSTKPSGTVLDIFGGSGSTLMACEQLGRTCYMVELSPRWCDVILQRWENATGEKATKIN